VWAVAERELGWPFGSTDGGPRSRPLVVHLEDVLVMVLPDDAAGTQALELLQQHGFADERLRLYTSEQIVAYDEAFRSERSLPGKVVGTIVDDNPLMGAYVRYGEEGCSALWVQLAHRDDATAVIRSLTDLGLRHVWFHGRRGIETLSLD
jgi:hypothetical protein